MNHFIVAVCPNKADAQTLAATYAKPGWAVTGPTQYATVEYATPDAGTGVNPPDVQAAVDSWVVTATKSAAAPTPAKGG